MRTAQDIMTAEVITISPDADITEAVKILLDKGVNGLPVVDESGHLVGILCQSDLVRMQKSLPIPSLFTLLDGFVPLSSSALLEAEVKRIAASKVSDAMSTKVVTIAPDMTIDEIAALMVDKKFHTLPVADNGKLLGIVGKKDVLKTLIPRS
ncbi:CBS domain-containing protein [Desulfomicrobium macestii]|uniref:CBS domain-containing protein n=2 Tax=Desulfomicrobium TaxID=898 RepID=A0A8G2C241_DESNO|nr:MULTISPECIES: CBS domain-containing protein [Desulfomicrobium]MBE1425806.1 CBS domain-containing protein [Desulfomicrobium macestii]SFL61249.1 CBS domain-containing protein [Desulfomicrobium norvegicum]